MNTENNNQSWVSQHTGALIGASGAIIAAVIAGIFLIASQSSDSGQSIEAPSENSEKLEILNNATPKKEETRASGKTMRNSTEFELASYKEIYDFAYKAGGMNQSSSDATKFADKWISKCTGESFTKFTEAYNFAYSASGMNMSSGDAKNWASNKFQCLQ